MSETPYPGDDLVIIAQFKVRWRSYLSPQGEVVRNPPALATDPEHSRALSRDGADPYLRSQGRLTAAHGSARHLCHVPRPGSPIRRCCCGHATRGRAVPSYRDNGALLWRDVTMEPALVLNGTAMRIDSDMPTTAR